MKMVLSHICKTYNGRMALRDCTATAESSGIYVLMGRNGSGKSTLLRICSLLEQPDSGSMVFFEKDMPIAQDLSLKRRITMVLSRTGIFNTTVFANVAYGMRIRNSACADIDQQVDRMLELVGLAHLKDRRATSLSSGEAQRLGMARALAIRPELLLLDEPTASVDEQNTEIIESIIAATRREGRTTILLTTHDRDQAERLADEIWVLNKNGELSREGR